MSHKVFNVLFLCTGNSARSILAEALVNNIAVCKDKFKGYSAGSFPKGKVHPLALELLKKNNFPIVDLRSKSWDELSQSDAPKMDFIITVCDNAAGEVCPIWPGHPLTAHWGIPDPVAVEGTTERKQESFLDAFNVLRRRIELLASLPLEKLDKQGLAQMDEIAHR